MIIDDIRNILVERTYGRFVLILSQGSSIMKNTSDSGKSETLLRWWRDAKQRADWRMQDAGLALASASCWHQDVLVVLLIRLTPRKGFDRVLMHSKWLLSRPWLLHLYKSLAPYVKRCDQDRYNHARAKNSRPWKHFRRHVHRSYQKLLARCHGYSNILTE